MSFKLFNKKNWIAVLISVSVVVSCMPTSLVQAAETEGITLSNATTLSSNRFFSSAYYQGYIYSISSTDSKLYVYNATTGAQVWSQEITGFRQSSSLNRHVYIKDAYLYVLSRNEGVIRYSLENPANPVKVTNYSGYNDKNWLEVEGDYIYLPDSSLKSVKISDGTNTTIASTQYNAVYSYDGYLYALKSGTIDVYNIEEDAKEPDLVGSKTTSFGTIQSVKAIGNTLFVAAQPSIGGNSYFIYWYNITSPEQIGNSSENTYEAPGTGNRRLADIAFINGMMLVCSTDNKLYTFDISSGADDGFVESLEVIQTDVSITGNPYKMTVTDKKFYFANTSLVSYEYEIKYLKLDNTDITTFPITISGVACGHESVTVELAGIQKTVSVDEFGVFKAVFDDAVLPNGTYTVNAYITDNDEVTDTCTVDIDCDRIDLSADYTNNTAEVDVTNLSETYDAALILVGYKNGQMADFDLLDDVELTKNILVEKTLSIDADTYDAVKLVVARKTNNGYVCTESSLLAGSDTNDFTANIESDAFEARCDMDFQNAKVGVNVSAKDAVGDILVIAKKPNGDYEYIDVIVADEETGLEFALKEPYVENQPYTVTVSSVAYGKYLFDDAEVTYIGETTINSILSNIDGAVDETEYFTFIGNNSSILNIDMSENSDFNKLWAKYKTAVYDALHENSYAQLGAVTLKLNFDAAVAIELENQAYEVAFNAVNSATTYTEFELALNNNDILDIDITEGFYSELSPESRAEVFDNLIDVEYSSSNTLKADLDKYSALWYVNEASYSQLEERIEETKDILNVAIPTEYDELSNARKNLFAREVTKNDYRTISLLVQAMEGAVEDVAEIASSANITIAAADSSISVTDATGAQRYAFDTYNGYAYTLNGDSNIVVYDCTGNTITMVQNDENNSYLNVGTYNNDRYNRYLYVEDGYLYVYHRLGSIIRQFSLLDNPANPKFVRDFSYTSGTAWWMDVYDGYLYVSNGSTITVFNLDTGDATMTSVIAKKFRCDDGYMYAVVDGKFLMYSLATPTNPILVTEKAMTYVSNGNVANRKANDIEYVNGYAFIPTTTGGTQTTDLWIIDVTDPTNMDKVDFVKLNGDDSYKRIANLEVKNGLLFASSVDGLYYIFDVSALPYVELIKTHGISGQHYITDVTDEYLYSFTGASITKYPITKRNVIVDNITITERPVKITGTSAGNDEVEVTFANMTKKVNVGSDGKFSATFNDDFIPNGTYTATAKLYEGETVVVEKTGTVVVSLEPKINVIESYLSGVANISVTNNGDAFDAIFITCGYKNGELFEYQIKESNIATSYFDTNTLTNYAQCDTVKSYLLKKTDDGYLVEWSGEEYGSALQSYTSSLTYSVNDLGVDASIEHSEKKVKVDMYSKVATGEIMVAVLKPGSTAINSTSLEYFTSVKPQSYQAATGFGLVSCVEDSDYTVFVSARGAGEYLYKTDTFKYYSPSILNPIFAQIEAATPETVEQILIDNQDKLAIDLSTESAYLLLEGSPTVENSYKNRVLSAVAGKNYALLGSTQLKSDFNTAVEEQTACMKVSNASTLAELVEQLNSNAILGINTEENGYYRKLTSESKQNIFTIMSKTYSDVDTIKLDYFDRTALEYVNQTAYDELSGVLGEVSSDLGLVFTDRYNSLAQNSTYLNYMLKEIAKTDYITATDLNTAISAAAEYVYTTYCNNSGNNGAQGGSSGGNGGGGIGANMFLSKEETEEKTVSFTDLGSVSWAQTAINSLAKDGVISGRNETTFAPLDSITREEFTKLVVLAFGYPVSNNNSVEFNDVAKERWSYEYISAAYKCGIINGVSDTDFAPGEKITRQDMAVMLHRVLKDKGIADIDTSKHFNDEDSISLYARDAVNVLAELGIINGVGDNTFAPKQDSNRAMAAQMIYNCLEYLQ